MNGSGAPPDPTGEPTNPDTDPGTDGEEALLLDLRSALHDDEGAVGIFPSWRAVYLAVLIYSLITVAILYLFTIALDFSAS